MRHSPTSRTFRPISHDFPSPGFWAVCHLVSTALYFHIFKNKTLQVTMLSASRSHFYATAVAGHNIVLTGQGGCGKSYVLKKFAQKMSTKDKHVAITCSTGIAATQFENGQTLHRWCGFGDGGIEKKMH